VGKRCDRTRMVKMDSRRGSSLEVLLVMEFDGLGQWLTLVRGRQLMAGIHLGFLMVIAMVKTIHDGDMFQGNKRATAAPLGHSPVVEKGREDDIVDSSFKRFVTFYFTNFLSQLSIFYLRKGFEVYGILEDVVVPSRRNYHWEYYSFVIFSKVRDVGKLLKAINVVWFGNFRFNSRVARFDRSVALVDDEKGEGDHVGEGRENGKIVVREKTGLHGDVEVKHGGEGEKSVRLGKMAVGGGSVEVVRGGVDGEGAVRGGKGVVPVRGGKVNGMEGGNRRWETVNNYGKQNKNNRATCGLEGN